VLTQATVTESVQDLIADLDVPVIVDCGAFSEDQFEGTLYELFDSYERMNADFGLIPDIIGERLETDDLTALATRLWQRGQPRWSFEPVAVAQGETPKEYASAYWDCYMMGADRIAIGGLLSTSGNRSGGHATVSEGLFDILRCIRKSHPKIWNDTWTFTLGCDHPRRRPRFDDFGVQAGDSKRWLFQYDQDLTLDRETQLVDEVTELATHRTPTLTKGFFEQAQRGSDL
jgi:hypothetical protein